MSAATHQHHTAQLPKAARRSPNTWVDRYPQRQTALRLGPSQAKPKIVRFPVRDDAHAPTAVDAVTQRLEAIQSAWSAREREQRRLEAIRKQEELLMLMADEMEDVLRLAVADGEQPILPPEIEVLRN